MYDDTEQINNCSFDFDYHYVDLFIPPSTYPLFCMYFWYHSTLMNVFHQTMITVLLIVHDDGVRSTLSFWKHCGIVL